MSSTLSTAEVQYRSTTSDSTMPWKTLIGLGLLRSALLTLLVLGIYFSQPALWHGSLIYSNALIIGVDLITLAVLARVLHARGQRIADVIKWRGRRDLGWAALSTVIVMVGFVVAAYVGNLIAYGDAPPQGPLPFVPLWVGLMAIPAAFTIAIAEETMYRGVLLDGLRRKVGPVVAVVVTSLFFALQHAPLAWMSPASVTAKLITTGLCGVLFAVMALRLRRLGPLIVAHVVVDLLGLSLPTLMLALSR